MTELGCRLPISVKQSLSEGSCTKCVDDFRGVVVRDLGAVVEDAGDVENVALPRGAPRQ